MTRTAKKKHRRQTVKLMRLGKVPVLAITTGNDTVFYKLETLLATAGKGFRLVKQDRGNGRLSTWERLQAALAAGQQAKYRSASDGKV